MEQQKQFVKQIVEFNKMAFHNSFNAMTMFQEQMEKVANAMLGQAAWIPEDGKKALDEMVKNYKQGRQDFKKVVDDGFDRMDSFISGGQGGQV